MIFFAKFAVVAVLATSGLTPTAVTHQEVPTDSTSIVVGSFSGSVGSLAGL